MQIQSARLLAMGNLDAGHSASLLAQLVLHSPYCCIERVLIK